MYQETFQSVLKVTQKHIDNLLYNSIQDLIVDKDLILKVSDGIVKSSVDYIIRNKFHLPELLTSEEATVKELAVNK